MTGDDARREEEKARVEELLRINAELAAEIRSLTLGRAERPRSTLLTATRRVAIEVGERDQVVARLESAVAEISALRQRNEELRHIVDQQQRELNRLRAGPIGIARRAKARLLRSRGR
jgi:hypothetical protein